MPQGDRTGPTGRGPKTGRGMGDCTFLETSEEADEVVYGDGRGRGVGLGRGRGAGLGQGFGRGLGRGRVW